MTILLSIDVEASGPCPGHGDMISFAAVPLLPGFPDPFDSGNMRPECDRFSAAAYEAIGLTREQHLAAPYCIEERMVAFRDHLQDRMPSANGRYVMVSDNPGFDFQWMNFEMWNKLGMSLLGHSARRIGDVYSGLSRRPRETMGWKRLRVTPHDHTPLNDALGNAEAWFAMWEKYGGNNKPY